ncbi:alanine--tRNA ligase [Polaromonas naphthalenivorans]|uniref:Alanine--tRNA ligase n=1 Tax=Polaromonas naphthalenivorans (strain CJ2) TaxID=365044 RepID=SYA_POLNA|nr:alanine--tRNA ligase [Polaromonas naphthalenivorans]A1VQK2.1 RecName: Full=Alanine--tRNA ligase; AltName: Full=Alanyl-tRNA synthetase; Short=AlaRS [Polaromonas naphthalenivorans CJ2]ABM37930.1 alanyl-tRNA synthetase [Polaromonas naphthalenivorans CJ2]
MSTPVFTVADIRKTFLDFFAAKGHTVVPSSSLVPGNDPTLMFTNSGMVQFKDVFLGVDKRPYVRATSVQACLRAGGKHNDLENVGYTARHHTFFEMLGNWSFGDYFKRESLKWAWELLTEVYKLPAERLLATVYEEDDEAYDIWTKEIGLPPERVIRIGDNKGGRYKSDNFWMMADTGPCGPCSEIFYDHGDHIPGGPPGSPDEDGDRFIEIWNNVFMQFNMAEDGSVTPLPAPCVDTGMGLERLAAILQHVHSNYEIDIFDALIKAASRETGEADLGHKSLRVIADHIRATAFLVSDGVNPSNEGRGYVQRRIIRRAIRHGYLLGKKTPFFHKLVADLAGLMGDAYPRLAADAQRITEVLKAEEERFFETLETGMQILDAALADGVKVLPGEVAFKLHDTYGFPLDLSADVCRERGLSVDEAGFTVAMNQQKAQARAAGKFKMDRALDYSGTGNVFTGYEHLEETSKIIAIYADGVSAAALKAGQNGVIVLDTTPFYAESGGQAGDEGELISGSARFAVSDTLKIKADVYGHHGTLAEGTLNVGDHVSARVNKEVRAATVRNHSATHLMHKALREVLGAHVQQKGSLVNAERTRFDFAHNAPMTDAQIREVEARVNAEILANSATDASEMDMEAAQKTGAMMLFGEKYGDSVRVLSIGSSKELCGGTHVGRTGDIGLFKIVAESGVASGVRRVEAVTGQNALAYLQSLESTVQSAAGTLKASPSELQNRIGQVLDQVKALEKEVAALKGKLASSQGDELMLQAVDVKGLKVLAARLEGADAKTLRETMDKLKDKLKTAVIVLAAVDGSKVQIAAGVTSDSTGKVKAGELVNFVAGQVGGKGGGKADMAMAGGTDASNLNAALDSVLGWVSAKL